jgi:DNA repair protein RecO
MQHETSKSIVLRSVFLKDKQKILSLFTERFGLISLIIKGCSSPIKGSLSEPFCEAEFSFTKSTSDIRRYQDASIIDLHLGLRNKLSYLKTASSMGKAILTSQLPDKASPHLYALLSTFLKQIPLFLFQETLLTCFYLKFLRHEGFYHKESRLPKLSNQDHLILQNIAYLQSFDKLKREEVSSSLFNYVESFFFEHLRD